MQNIKWDLLKVLQAVAKTNNISKASKYLNTDQSTVSRSLKNLETNLGVKLFKRLPSGVEITEQGKILLETVENFTSDLNVSLGKIKKNTNKDTSGKIVIQSSMHFGNYIISKIVQKFIAKYPHVRVTLLLNNEDYEKIDDDVDIFFTPQLPKKERFIFQSFFNTRRHAFASKKYLIKNGTPKTIDDLQNHNIIVTLPYIDVQLSEREEKIIESIKESSVITVNSLKVACDFIENDIGISILPDYMASDKFVKIFENIYLENKTYYMALPYDKRNLATVVLFKSFILEEIKNYHQE